MFYTHHDKLTKGYRTLKQAAVFIVQHTDLDEGQVPIYRKVKTRPAPFDAEIAAYVRTDNKEEPYLIRIDRDGYEIIDSWTRIN